MKAFKALTQNAAECDICGAAIILYEQNLDDKSITMTYACKKSLLTKYDADFSRDKPDGAYSIYKLLQPKTVSICSNAEEVVRKMREKNGN